MGGIMSKTKNKKIAATILIAVILIIVSYNVVFKKQDKSASNNKIDVPQNKQEEPIELLFYKAYPYKQLFIPGDNLIDGIYGNRSLYIIKLNTTNVIESIKYRNNDKALSFNNFVIKNTKGTYLISVCDNIIDPGKTNINLSISFKNNNKIKTTTSKIKLPVKQSEDFKITSSPKIYINKENSSKNTTIINKEYIICTNGKNSSLYKDIINSVDEQKLKNTGLPYVINTNVEHINKKGDQYDNAIILDKIIISITFKVKDKNTDDILLKSVAGNFE